MGALTFENLVVVAGGHLVEHDVRPVAFGPELGAEALGVRDEALEVAVDGAGGHHAVVEAALRQPARLVEVLVVADAGVGAAVAAEVLDRPRADLELEDVVAALRHPHAVVLLLAALRPAERNELRLVHARLAARRRRVLAHPLDALHRVGLERRVVAVDETLGVDGNALPSADHPVGELAVVVVVPPRLVARVQPDHFGALRDGLGAVRLAVHAERGARRVAAQRHCDLAGVWVFDVRLRMEQKHSLTIASMGEAH